MVATDDERIAACVQGFGGQVAMTSPDCESGTDRVAEVARARDEELVVNLQGDEPEFDPVDVDRLVAEMARDRSLPLGTLAAVTEDPQDALRPSVVKVVRDRSGDALYFSRAPIPFDRDGTPGASRSGPAPLLRHVGIYAFRREALLEFASLEPTALERTEKLEQLRALENGWRIRVVTAGHAPRGIDTPEDFELFRRRVEAGAGEAHIP